MIEIGLDFECADFWISAGRGSGWPEKQAKFLCGATVNGNKEKIWTNIDSLIKALQNKVASEDEVVIIAHNAQYEAGILYSYGFDIESVTWIDTRLLAILYNNNLESYSLDYLVQYYLKLQKTQSTIGDIARSIGLVKTKSQNAVQIAYDNFDKIYEEDPETVQKYCQQDIRITMRLYNYLKELLNQGMYFKGGWDELVAYHSDLIKIFTLMRAKGILASKSKASESKFILNERMEAVDKEIKEIAGDINVKSSKQLAEYFISQGITLKRNRPTAAMLKKNPNVKHGNYILDKEALEEIDHPLAEKVVQYKKLSKYISDYLDAVLNLPSETDLVRVYPNFMIYGASKTGRPSCNEPNMLQIPKRDPDSYYIRRIYCPEPGEKLVELDYKIQEPRLQLHFAHQLGDQTAFTLIEEFKVNPDIDLHHRVACMIHGKEVPKKGKERTESKGLNLGLSYGMGQKKLAKSLGLSDADGKILLDKFHSNMPYIKVLTTYCMEYLKTRGFITTIFNRRLYRESWYDKTDHKVVFFDYKALNKRTQGSAADQTYKAMRDCYKQGILLMLQIYDAFVLSTDDYKVVDKVKHIMENSVKLHIPSGVDVEYGESWGELKKYEGVLV